ncbi:aminotransferase class I/II-fold pyridoxal phosphate-dependent enzyme, partial [Arthrospira platensis SPKY1]|nr:aminotransferase class I/II-fold pyridoxal phosphate-dependent enzyme [Arthrospira platensis SPKY1]
AAIQAIEDGLHGYTMNAGTPELREAICDKLKRDNGLDYKPSQIVVSNGAKQSVGFSIWATINPGDEVIIPAPYWVSYPSMVELAEGVPVCIRTAFEDDFKLSPAALEAAITPKTRGFILCTPSNPTGSCYTEAELKALGEVLLKYPDVLIY